VLARNRRGHGVEATRRALALLRRAGFKLQAHWMPNLLGATPASDAADFARLFDDPALRPDELKIYPCSLIEGTELMEQHRAGAWRPYETGELVDLLGDCLRRVPPWCRVSRVIRDISSHDIVAGNRIANLREVVERRLAVAGTPCRDIRAREIRDGAFDPAALRLREERYATSSGEERFLELATPDGRIVALARLALPAGEPALPELGRGALLREVHVYGRAAAVGRRPAAAAQHRGLGSRLVARAAALAREAGHPALSVISAVGTRAWYRSLGFRDGPLYQHLALGDQAATALRAAAAPAISSSSASVSAQPMHASVIDTP